MSLCSRLAAAALTGLLTLAVTPSLHAQCDAPGLSVSTQFNLAPSSLGTLIPGSDNVDDAVFAVPAPPFPLRFGGRTYSIARVSTNGILQFDSGALSTDFFNSPPPNTSFGTAIFPFFDDLITFTAGPGTANGLYTNTTGTTPNRLFEVRWRVSHISDRSVPFSFSIYFYENPNQPEFVLAYSPTASSFSTGISATIGLQASAIGPASLYSFNQAVVTAGLNLVPNCNNRAPFTYQGRLLNGGAPVNGTADLTFTFVDAAGNSLGTTLARPATPVSAGTFTTSLSLPPNVDLSNALPLVRITVNGTLLTPDQPLTPTPAANFAFRSYDAETATTAASVPWSGITGVPANITAAFSPWTPSGSNISFTAGNVGIGITSPNYQLSLGSSLGNTKLALWESGADAFGLGIQASQFRFHVPNAANRFSFLDGPAGTERLTILGTGNVGIGTPAPGAALDVRGNIRLGSTGQYNAASANAEQLSTIRGIVNADGTIRHGAGYTVTRLGIGQYRINWPGTPGFSDFPAITATALFAGSPIVVTVTQGLITPADRSGFADLRTLTTSGGLVDSTFSFTMTGPR